MYCDTFGQVTQRKPKSAKIINAWKRWTLKWITIFYGQATQNKKQRQVRPNWLWLPCFRETNLKIHYVILWPLFNETQNRLTKTG